MKKMIAFLLLIFCQFSLRGNEMFVFAVPIEEGRTDLLKEAAFFNSREETHLFQGLGISACYRWIQKLQNCDFLIHLVKGDDVKKSFEILKCEIVQKSETALQMHQLYQEALNIDLALEDLFATSAKLTHLQQVDVEREDRSFTKEYCFIYPILPSKKEKLQKMFQEKSEYWSQQVQDVYRYRGISKQQLWIQERENACFLVVYQEITGPVTEARGKYLDSKEEQFSYNRAVEFSDMTGLSYEELLPKLESLFDSEILD